MKETETKSTDSFFKRLAKSLEDWASTDFHVPTFILGTASTSELINKLSLEPSHSDVYLSDKESACLPPDLLIISGMINHKNLRLVKREYKKLIGKKYVVILGEPDNDLLKSGYNIVNDLTEHLHVDLTIPGSPPSKEDILNGLDKLKELR